MKVVIVNVNRSRIDRNVEYHLFTLKAFLDERAEKVETEIVNVFMTDDMVTTANLLKSKNVEIFLFRVLYWNAAYILKLAEQLRTSGAIKGLWGHDTFSHPEEYLKKDFDFVIQDEPELSLYELAMLKKNGGDVGSASGVVYKDRVKKTFIFGESKVLDDLDLIPSPYLKEMVSLDENTVVYWEVARGCSFKCDFCVEFSKEGNLRYHSFSYLEKELQHFVSKGVSQIVVGCPIFNLSHQHFVKILDMLKTYLPYASVEVQVRPELLSREDLEAIAEMDLFLNIGLQTVNQKVHENLMTSLNVENALSSIRHMANYPNISFSLDVIAGLPKMNFEDFLSDLEAAFNLWPVSLNVYRLSLYPGTRIYNKIREYDYTVEHTYPYRVLETPVFSKREFEKVDELAEGIELLYNKGRMVSIITMLSKGLEMPCHEIVSRWNKWIKKQATEISADSDKIDYDELFGYINSFFEYLFDRFQKKKLWSIASDILKHNHFYTTSLMTLEEDVLTYPYQISAINPKTVIGINASSFFDKFSYDIEDITEAGYIDLRRYLSEINKENMCGVVYRLDGSVFTKTISDEEGKVFAFIQKKKKVSIAEIQKNFKNVDVLDLVSFWCDEGVLYIAQ
ncbi:MAG: B12-binding domain-containing radical SAM protein [bacterium]